MSYQVVKPAGVFASFVKQYWAVENCMDTGRKSTIRIVPSGLPELTFYFSKKPRVVEPNSNYPDNSFFSGQQKSFSDIELDGNLHLFSVAFQPHAPWFLFKIPAHEFHNRNVSFKDILKDEGHEVEQRLALAGGLDHRVRIINDFLLQKLKKNYFDYQYKRIDNSLLHINSMGGMVEIDFLASSACLGRKQFERTFLDFIGTTPGQFLKIVRFQQAIYKKQKGEFKNFTSLAHECGFFDQAHMTNDFKQLSGMTPKQYFADCEAHSDYFGS